MRKKTIIRVLILTIGIIGCIFIIVSFIPRRSKMSSKKTLEELYQEIPVRRLENSVDNKLMKEEDGVTAILAIDISKSMEGESLLKLKEGLYEVSSLISEDTNLGLVTFSDAVNIALPIAPFEINQKAMFLNAVDSMSAGGSTAMFDAIVVSLHMLVEQQANHSNVKPIMIVLTDGESNRGYAYEDIEEITKELGIPIYTIGYQTDITVLSKLSKMNGAFSINADLDNITDKLKLLVQQLGMKRK